MGRGRSAKRVIEYDWAWVGTEVTTTAGITLTHQRRAAGMVCEPCPGTWLEVVKRGVEGTDTEKERTEEQSGEGRSGEGVGGSSGETVEVEEASEEQGGEGEASGNGEGSISMAHGDQGKINGLVNGHTRKRSGDGDIDELNHENRNGDGKGDAEGDADGDGDGNEYEWIPYEWGKANENKREKCKATTSSRNGKEVVCSEKKCAGWPRCYNHLGIQGLYDPKVYTAQIEAKIPPATEMRLGPAGLKNFGATCYANAFLQLWYHNIPFRNGVYSCVSGLKSTSPLSHLATVFAMLQRSRRAVIDPEPLIDALRLDKGDQQDAAEFSKLFMSLVASEFTRQPGPLKSFVTDLFEGKLAYVTRCNHCGYTSRHSSPFLELEISLKDKASLMDRIDHLLTPEALDGDNRYRCPQCAQLRPATRSTQLESLPPVLHFSLLRFVYDPMSGTRKKSKALIAYPREMRISGQEYELRGVVTHHGISAFHGHFTCEVYDEEEKQWYNCDDSSVTKVASQQARKKIKLDSDMIDEQTSRDAYMLVYVKKDLAQDIQMPPAEILERIDADNVALDNEATTRAQTRKEMLKTHERLRRLKEPALLSLSGDDRAVPRTELIRWISATTEEELGKPFDLDPIRCKHGALDPSKTSNLTLISSQAFTALRETCMLPIIVLCPMCIEDEFKERLKDIELRDRVVLFDELNLGDRKWEISRNWVRDWRNGVLKNSEGPSHPTYSLLCQHGQPWSGKSVDITDAALAHLRSIYGDFPAFTSASELCATCGKMAAQESEARAEWTLVVKRERQVWRNQRNLWHMFGLVNVWIPPVFAKAWEAFMETKVGGVIGVAEGTDGPGSLAGRPRGEWLVPPKCEHGMIAYDLEMDKGVYLSLQGWETLCELYEHDPGNCVLVTFVSVVQPFKRFAIDNVSVETCLKCRKARLLDFIEAKIFVKVGKEADAVVVGSGNRRATRSTAKETALTVKKSTTVKDIKVELLNTYGISPICQRLYHNGRELATSETIEVAKILADDQLVLVEVEEEGEVGDEGGGEGEGRRREGFGGTVLLGRIACPECTFENEPGSRACEMCETAFA